MMKIIYLLDPLFRGLGVRTNNGENLADMQMLTEEIGASLQAAVKVNYTSSTI